MNEMKASCCAQSQIRNSLFCCDLWILLHSVCKLNDPLFTIIATVCEIMMLLGIVKSSFAFIVKVLKESKLIFLSQRRGVVYYSLSSYTSCVVAKCLVSFTYYYRNNIQICKVCYLSHI